ncbi:asparaginase [Clostridium sp. P21]|uniref:asparaginase n=1 Tax=Clostridium muellerianum TaxID=2716538 RepID=A0A7Y0EHZ4_9CLOT|nr:asparaginase [Clostridium muellerianum]NMM63727.1 asparaginase [Clostridium muellerianum]
MKKVIIIFTGGTISMKRDENNVAVPSMSGEDILKLTPGIEKIANIDFLNFGMIPGPHMTPEKMMKLSKLISKKVEVEGYDGVVVTHGTDSLEETAYLVDLTYNGSKPIVFVGSMKSSSDLGWDGPPNLIDAVNTVISEDSVNRGVMVVMNKEVHAASQVTKTNTHSLDTFKSMDFGPVGIVDNNKVNFYYSYNKKQYIPAEKVDSNVALIKCGCGMDDSILRFCVDAGSHGIVIEGMGRGNIPPKMVCGVEYALSKNIPVVLVSRCPMGKVSADYGYEGAGRELTEKGVILGDNLPGQKARIKLIAALGFTKDLNKIKDIFEKSFY